ncbi:hypothetical protein NQ314_003752 [Rhamnusium bicolor]|uniref:Tyr recombinase domain-containing protein n=1 Tax=Rhamnusium bicolor TaxID=1586634 RepID=A0AAV8ZLH7_9CUCU|nr:hypothetical protein NQ314_003752 [Rhamnusium bicolor]
MLKCPERLKLIETLRRNGNFVYNTNAQYNNGDLIVCRRPLEGKARGAQNFETCYNCKGFFSKLTIKRHVDRCSGMSKCGDRTVMMMGRKIRSAIHPKACHTLKNEIFPILKEDFIVKAVCYDELLILYCNQLCLKYRSQHNHKQVRSFIRLMGRFLLAVKKRKATITYLKHVFHPENYNLVVESVNEVARLTDDGQYYGAPSVASNMGTYLKKIGNFLIGECIKNCDEQVKKQTEDFIHLIKVSYSADVTRTALETQQEMARHRKIELPLQEDLKTLYLYINKNRIEYQRVLSDKFDIAAWTELAKFTLLTLHIFNARRAGEIKRILISDFEKFQTVDKDTDTAIFNSLSTEGQRAAKCYGRFVIRGKLGRNVPVLLHIDHLACAELILRYRLQAGVPEKNPYLFGLPSSVLGRHKWLDACVLMRKYSVECGAVRPDLLRGTTLRKHLATQSIFLNLQEEDISDLAQFMGHADKIHRSHYRLPVPAREIAQISVLLEKAVGIVRTESGLLVESSDEEVELNELNA